VTPAVRHFVTTKNNLVSAANCNLITVFRIYLKKIHVARGCERERPKVFRESESFFVEKVFTFCPVKIVPASLLDR